MSEILPAVPSQHDQLVSRQAAIEGSLHNIQNPLERAGMDPQGNIVGAHDVQAERYAVAVNEALGDGNEGEAWTAKKIRAELVRDPEIAARFDALAERSATLQELDEALAADAEMSPESMEAGKVAVRGEAALETDFDQEIADMDAAVEQTDGIGARIGSGDAVAASVAALETPGANNNGVNNEEFSRQQLLATKLDLRSLRLAAQSAHPKTKGEYIRAIDDMQAEEALWVRVLKSEGSLADDAFVRERAMSLRDQAKRRVREGSNAGAAGQSPASEDGKNGQTTEEERSPLKKLSELREEAEQERVKVSENLKQNKIFVCLLTPALEALRETYPEDDALAGRLDAFAEHVNQLDRQKRDAGEDDTGLALSNAIHDTYETFLSNAERQAFARASENEKQRQIQLTAKLENALVGSSMAPPPAFLFTTLCKEIL